MYDLIIPVTKKRDPIVVEGASITHILLYNAGPGSVRASVWNDWHGKVDGNYSSNLESPNLQLTLMPGNQLGLSGSFIRIGIDPREEDEKFAAVGVRILPSIE